jgi:hypothetical protein
MFKRLLTGVAGSALVAGLASAQTYPPPTTPPEIPAPSIRAPVPGTSTTTVAPSLQGGWQATTTRHGLDAHGNPVTQRDIYGEGLAGGSESYETVTTDPRAGGTTYEPNASHDPQ